MPETAPAESRKLHHPDPAGKRKLRPALPSPGWSSPPNHSDRKVPMPISPTIAVRLRREERILPEKSGCADTLSRTLFIFSSTEASHPIRARSPGRQQHPVRTEAFLLQMFQRRYSGNGGIFSLLVLTRHCLIFLINRAGTPPTIALAGTSPVTTAPAATMAFSPTVTPGKMVAPAPIHAFCPITMGRP